HFDRPGPVAAWLKRVTSNASARKRSSLLPLAYGHCLASASSPRGSTLSSGLGLVSSSLYWNLCAKQPDRVCCSGPLSAAAREEVVSMPIKVIWHVGQKRMERGRFIWPTPADAETISPAQLSKAGGPSSPAECGRHDSSPGFCREM